MSDTWYMPAYIHTDTHTHPIHLLTTSTFQTLWCLGCDVHVHWPGITQHRFLLGDRNHRFAKLRPVGSENILFYGERVNRPHVSTQPLWMTERTLSQQNIARNHAISAGLPSSHNASWCHFMHVHLPSRWYKRKQLTWVHVFHRSVVHMPIVGAYSPA